MKHTEEQIKKIGIKILQDIEKEYFSESLYSHCFFEPEDKIIYGLNKGKLKPTWTIVVNSLFDNRDYLIISDDTGEPLYYVNFNLIITEILKNEDGKYYRNMPWLEE